MEYSASLITRYLITRYSMAVSVPFHESKVTYQILFTNLFYLRECIYVYAPRVEPIFLVLPTPFARIIQRGEKRMYGSCMWSSENVSTHTS